VSHELVRTRGGALAVRSLEAGEIMHPGVGPRVEAEALYVRQARLEERLRAGPLVLFDVGLGAGSNALAARAAAVRSGGALELVSFERDLRPLELALEHAADFGFDEDGATAARALLAEGQHQDAQVRWRLAGGDLLVRLAEEPARADVIFWDPYSPRANPDLWTIAAFRIARAAAGPRCTLFTYSASTAVRVAMLLAGWAVGDGDGSGTKTHTTAAAVEPGDLARPLDRAWLTRLAQPNAPLPLDAPADAAARVALLPQFRPGR
jgi:queuine tRNA-ribosyltransferase